MRPKLIYYAINQKKSSCHSNLDLSVNAPSCEQSTRASLSAKKTCETTILWRAYLLLTKGGTLTCALHLSSHVDQLPFSRRRSKAYFYFVVKCFLDSLVEMFTNDSMLSLQERTETEVQVNLAQAEEVLGSSPTFISDDMAVTNIKGAAEFTCL